MRFPVTGASLAAAPSRLAQWLQEALPTVATAVALGGACIYLLARLVRDVAGKPIYDDEALAGLIAARPLTEVIETVMGDRGGAPLHFVLAHLTLAFDSSPAALRALSVVFAVATVIVCYDLGRRLSGRLAGVVTAIVAASSELLLVYGSFARMYAVFAFAAALALDLFVRAVELRTARAAAFAALAALLLPASHPYGLAPFAVEAGVALAAWRGRPVRAALPVVAIACGVIPFLAADLRLADRFSLGIGGDPLGQRRSALDVLEEALRGSGGGSGALFVAFAALAAAGLLLTARRSLTLAALFGGTLAAPLVVLLVARTSGGPAPLSSRYLIFLLPLWGALVGVAVAGVAERVRALPRVGAVAFVAALALLAPGTAVTDPRTLRAATPAAVSAPAAWVRANAGPRDVLFPYSPVYLAALPEAANATVLSRARPGLLLAELGEADLPVASAVVAVPNGDRFEVAPLGARARVHRFPSWVLVEVQGPFGDPAAVLRALLRAVEAVRPADPFLRKAESSLRAALCSLGKCPPP
jgi:Dolichyl-phosphate-mannose-protein mannosyltransferase